MLNLKVTERNDYRKYVPTEFYQLDEVIISKEVKPDLLSVVPPPSKRLELKQEGWPPFSFYIGKPSHSSNESREITLALYFLNGPYHHPITSNEYLTTQTLFASRPAFVHWDPDTFSGFAGFSE